MNKNVIITCAVTGSGDSVGKHPDIPVTPTQIADAAIEAAKAGAAVAHIHVREPDTGKPSRRVDLFREVVGRIRESDTDVIINLTTGMGGDLFFGPDDNPLDFQEPTDCVGQVERLAHVEELLPEICSMDCGSFNYGGGNYVYISTPDMLTIGAKRLQALGVKPELEVFEMGHISFARHLIDQGLLDSPPLFQVCLGLKPWSTTCPLTVTGPVSASRRGKCRWWHRQCCSAAMCGSVWRTISTLKKVCLRRTDSS